MKSFYILKYPEIFNHDIDPYVLERIVDFLDRYQNVKPVDDIWAPDPETAYDSVRHKYVGTVGTELVWKNSNWDIIINFDYDGMRIYNFNNTEKIISVEYNDYKEMDRQVETVSKYILK